MFVLTLTLVGLAAGLFGLVRSAGAEDCSNWQANLTGQVLSHEQNGRATGRVTNSSVGCTYTVGIASYKLSAAGESLYNYRLYGPLGPGKTVTSTILNVAVPDCRYRIRVFEGENPNNPNTLNMVEAGNPLCAGAPTPTPTTPTPTPATPTPTPSTPTPTPATPTPNAPTPTPVPGTPTPNPTPIPTPVPGQILPGTLTAVCVGGIVPRVQLSWTPGVNANSNSIEKGDLFPNDPNQFWGFIFQETPPIHTFSFVDTNVTLNNTYSYRVKYAPTVPSNVVTVFTSAENCGFSNPTPTPTPPSSGLLNIVKMGRNLTKNIGERSALLVSPGDTVEFVLRVRNTVNVTLTNVIVEDIMPAALTYINGTTTVNGVVTANGITTGGINIGSLAPNQESTVRFSVNVRSFPVGTVLENVATARADNAPLVSSRMTLNRGQVAGASTVQTGPGSTFLISLVLSLLVTGTYMRYTKTEIFRRRSALAFVRRSHHDRERLNFARFE
ncbi:MAG: DUF11 domain-containing protein [Candidatus Yanofskybacteria bacterium]|nr:DUF11 domain-containing protein [Candidatus Yanofskybacteria bacterium]